MQYYIPHKDIYVKCASLLQSRFLFPPTSLNRGRRDLRYRTMADRYRGKGPTLLNIVPAHGLGRKHRPTIDRFPAQVQTSPSATSCAGSLDRMLIYFIPFLQFSNFQMNSSFPFSLTSPPTRTSPVIMPGSTCHILRCHVFTTISGHSFYGR